MVGRPQAPRRPTRRGVAKPLRRLIGTTLAFGARLWRRKVEFRAQPRGGQLDITTGLGGL